MAFILTLDAAPIPLSLGRERSSGTGALGLPTTSLTALRGGSRGRYAITKIVAYSARHTYGTYTMENSRNAFAVAKSMGHVDLKSKEPYQHQELEPPREIIDQRNRQKSVVRFYEIHPS